MTFKDRFHALQKLIAVMRAAESAVYQTALTSDAIREYDRARMAVYRAAGL